MLIACLFLHTPILATCSWRIHIRNTKHGFNHLAAVIPRIIGGVSYWVLCVNTLNDALFPKWKDGKGKDSCQDTDPEEDAVQVPYVLPDPG